ncbi:MAG: hypothetical protein K1Y36_01280 [Blastocatellia bacterium]|nr:hypothetical protein [Blastocatellia bacterium]
MFRKIALSVYAAIALFCLPALAQSTAPAKSDLSLDEIIAKHAQARGGLDKLKAIKSIKMTGKLVVQGGALEIPMVIQAKRPDMFRMEMSLQGKTQVQAFDGTVGWTISPFMGKTDPEKMPEEDTVQAKDQADGFFEGSLLNAKAMGKTVELAGKEDVEGSDAYKLKITDKKGDVEFEFLDAKSFLTIKSASKRKMQGNELEVESFPGDFKEVNGVMFPFSLEQKAKGGPAGGGAQIVIEKIELDVAVDDAIFKFPAKDAAKEPAKK